MKLAPALFIALLALPRLASAQHAAPASPSAVEVKAASALSVARCRTVSLVNTSLNSPVPMEVDGVQYFLKLIPNSVRTAGFRMLVPDSNGTLVEFPAPPVTTFRGEIFDSAGIARGRVSGNRVDGGLRAVLCFNNGESRILQPISGIVSGAQPGDHALFTPEDSAPSSDMCATTGTTVFNFPPPTSVKTQKKKGQETVALAATTGTKVCEIAFDLDFEGFLAFSSSTVDAMAWIEGLVNDVSAIYEPQVGLIYQISTVIIRTAEPDPYTATEHTALLGEMKSHWNSQQTSVKRDVAYLYTGKAIQNLVVGYAQLHAICNTSNAYGFSRAKHNPNYAKVVANLAHELGHLWGLGHCDMADPACGIMCLSLGGCNGSLTNFGAAMTTQLSALINSAGCLTVIPQPLTPPVVDSFPKSPFSPSIWTTVDGATVNSGALLEPSGTLSANLDNTDELRSNKISLAGQTAIDIGWFVECRGAENGEKLHVEYFNQLSQWTSLAVMASDGAASTSFVYQKTSLPLDAFHNEFRFRFRAQGDEENDDWFVDQVGLDVAPAPASRFSTEGVDPVVFRYVQGSSAPSAPVVPIANGGDATLPLPWSAVLDPPVAWLSVTTASGTLQPIDPPTSTSITPALGALSPGLYTTKLVVSKTGGSANDTIPLPVAAAVATATFFQPGDRLQGTIADTSDFDTAAFLGLAGSTLTLNVEAPGGGLSPTVDLRDVAGNLIKSQKIKNSTKATKKTFKLATSGIFTIRISGGSGTTGTFDIATSITLPKTALALSKSYSPKTPGGTVEIPFAAAAGTRLQLTVLPLATNFDMSVEIVDPNGTTHTPGNFGTTVVGGGLHVEGFPLALPGNYKARILGFTSKEKVQVTLNPQAPSAGNSTIIID